MKNRKMKQYLSAGEELYAAGKAHNVLKTRFWRSAWSSLPESVRARYLADIAEAERVELALTGMIEALARAKASVTAWFQTPRGAH